MISLCSNSVIALISNTKLHYAVIVREKDNSLLRSLLKYELLLSL